MTDIRRLVYGLRPPVLDELGLVAALREQAVQYTSGPSIHFDVPDSLPELAAAVEVEAYRIALEALTNVVRHARARSCTIRLELNEAAMTLTVEVRDDGQGCLRDCQRGVGLTSMRERAEELGGWVVLEPVPTGGLVVRAQLPCVLSSPFPVSERPLSSPS
ncbi:sensor histidine kinase [Ktedonobacter robiniae]|uniref:sensor histidine kinase n=1 Tax=Ktedonobacter robiniae TaxID=2778365 RepID=UPI001915B956|nr:ATP-binding protein [Ktedonobacter robiniae]